MGLGLGLKSKLQNLYWSVFRYYYKEFCITRNIKRIQKKDSINVVFIIHSLGAWKTEGLYKLMLAHPMYRPILLITHNWDCNEEEIIKKYLLEREYSFSTIEKNEKLYERFSPDIIFYQKGYDWDWFDNNSLHFTRNLKSLICYIAYSFHTIDEKWCMDTEIRNMSWRYFFENNQTRDSAANIMRNRGENIVVTGVPMMDSLLQDKSKFKDPWKTKSGIKKKIIWAPHHSISSSETLSYSTFLEYAQSMLDFAYKYRNTVQFAFKPHPILKEKLNQIWGVDMTNDYYRKWEELENCQLEDGEYMGLFKYSDALIHDCSSFQVEYHYTLNPVLFLVKDENKHKKGLNDFAKTAYDLHYKAYNVDDIDTFIKNVLDGVDPRKSERISFYEKSLKLPYGRTASENIISSILRGLHMS